MNLDHKIETLTQQREVLRSNYEKIRHLIDVARLDSTEASKLLPEYSDKKAFPWTTELERVRCELFRIHEWRPLQLPAINAFLDNRDVILIMPTGLSYCLFL